MIKYISIGTMGALVAMVALAAQVGCSKDENKDAAKKPMPAKSAKASAASATPVKTTATPAAAADSKASTKLLALKFHHDD